MKTRIHRDVATARRPGRPIPAAMGTAGWAQAEADRARIRTVLRAPPDWRAPQATPAVEAMVEPDAEPGAEMRMTEPQLEGACASSGKPGEPAGAAPEPAADAVLSSAELHRAARAGVSGPRSTLPFMQRIQDSFGPDHDLSGVAAHIGASAAEASDALGARAYTVGESIAFGALPDLRLVAHEAAHVIQQRAGISLEGGTGRPGDRYERQARAAAELVVRGRSAAQLFAGVGPTRGGTSSGAARQVQCDSFTSIGVDGDIVVNEPESLRREQQRADRVSAERLYYQLAANAGDETAVFADNASVEDLLVYLRANPTLRWPEAGKFTENVRFLRDWDRARSKLPHVPMRLDQKLSGTVRFADNYPLFYTGQTPPPVTIEWKRNAATNFWLGFYSRGVLQYEWEMSGPRGKVQRLKPADLWVQTTAYCEELDKPGTYFPRVTIRMGRGGPGNELTWVGQQITATAITREQFAAEEYRKAVTQKDAEGNDPAFRLDAKGLPSRLPDAKQLDFQNQLRFNAVRIGALKKYRELNKLSQSDFEKAKQYFEAKSEGLRKAQSALPGGSRGYLVSGVFVSSQRPLSIVIHAYMASMPNRAGKIMLRLYDATLNQKQPTEHNGEAAYPEGPIDHAKSYEAERQAVDDMASHWKANNDYPPGTVYLAISSHENPEGGFKVTIPQNNWKKTLRSILAPVAFIAAVGAMAFGQAEISVPLMYVATGAGLASIALGIEHRIKMGTFAFDGALVIDILSVIGMVMGLGAITRTFQSLSYGGKAWYLVGMAANDVTQGILIRNEAASALDEAKAEFNGEMATAKNEDERRAAKERYERASAEIIGGAVVSEGFIVVSVAGGVKGVRDLPKAGPGIGPSGAPPVEPQLPHAPSSPSGSHTVQDVKPVVPQPKPPVQDVKPPAPQPKPRVPEVKPPVPQVKPAVHDVKPPTPEVKPAVPEVKPPAQQPKPVVQDVKPPAAPTAPAATKPSTTTPGTKVQRPIPPGGTPIDAPGRKPPKQMMDNPDLYYFENGKFKRRPEPAPPFRPQAQPPTGVKVTRPIPQGGIPIDSPGLKPPQKLLDNKDLYYYEKGRFLRRPEPAPPFRQPGGKDPRAIPCFPEGTPVATVHGATPIQTIAAGGQVLAYDETLRATTACRVSAVLRNRTATLVDIALGMEAAEIISATAGHRFWVENRAAFIPADRLEPGYLLRTALGQLQPIERVSMRPVAEIPTWNLTVDGCHTYFVGASRVLVHNDGESGGKIYIGRNPKGQIVYVGLTLDDLLDRQAAHRQDAINDPMKYGFKKDITLEVVDGMTGLTEDEMRWHERRVYDELKARGEPLQNVLEETTSYEKLNALYEKYC